MKPLRSDKNCIATEPELVPVSRIKTQFQGFSDGEIWDRFRKGEREAFIYIYYSYYPVLYNYGHQLSTGNELVEDCIQEVFVDLHRSAKRLSATNSIKYYLIKSLKTKYLRTIKNVSRVKENEKYYPGYDFRFTISAEEKIINAQLNDELLQKLNNALESLTSRQREVMYYFFYENLTVDEIADIIGVTHRRTIQNTIYRSIAFLRRHIDVKVLALFSVLFGGKIF